MRIMTEGRKKFCFRETKKYDFCIFLIEPLAPVFHYQAALKTEMYRLSINRKAKLRW
jgi:hypothetical protein